MLRSYENRRKIKNERSVLHIFFAQKMKKLPHLDGGMVRHWGAGSLAEHAALAELNANIRLEPGKHELTAEEIAAASCTAFVNRYKAFAPSPAARTRLKAKTRTTRRPWANFFLDF